MNQAMSKSKNKTDTSFNDITILSGEPDYLLESSFFEESSVSTDYNFETISTLGNDILGQFDDYLILSREEDSNLALKLREQLETFFIGTKYKLMLQSQISSIDWEFSRFEFFQTPVGISDKVAKRLWDNEEDEWWDDL